MSEPLWTLMVYFTQAFPTVKDDSKYLCCVPFSLDNRLINQGDRGGAFAVSY